MALRFTSNSAAFFSKSNAFVDQVQGRMAIDIDRAIKISAGTPVKIGNMKSMVRAYKSSASTWRVEANAEYSAVQEAGVRLSGKGAPTRQFSHYTTPGTSFGWFRRAINSTLDNFDSYVHEAQQAVGL